MELDDHTRGLVLTVAGVLALVPDATLIRAIEADTITTAMWRNALIAVTVTTALALRYGRRLPSLIRRTGRAGILSAILWATSTSLFVAAVDYTTVGNTVLIVAVSPMWAALFSRLLGDRVARRTAIAIPFAVLGVAIAFQASIGTGRLVGDLFALGASVGVAANLTLLRRHSEVDFVPAVTTGAWLAFGTFFLLGGSFTLAPSDVAPTLALGVVFLPAAIVLITTGARYLPSPETALIILLETVLSPILAAVAVDEPIATSTVVGGVIVIVTLVAHATAGQAAARRRLAPVH